MALSAVTVTVPPAANAPEAYASKPNVYDVTFVPAFKLPTLVAVGFVGAVAAIVVIADVAAVFVVSALVLIVAVIAEFAARLVAILACAAIVKVLVVALFAIAHVALVASPKVIVNTVPEPDATPVAVQVDTDVVMAILLPSTKMALSAVTVTVPPAANAPEADASKPNVYDVTFESAFKLPTLVAVGFVGAVAAIVVMADVAAVFVVSYTCC